MLRIRFNHRGSFGREGSIQYLNPTFRNRWPRLSAWAGPMFEPGCSSVLRYLSKYQVITLTLPGPLGFMHTILPRRHAAGSPEIPDGNLMLPPVNVHAMGRGQAKSQLSRLDSIQQWFLFQEVLEGRGGTATILQGDSMRKINSSLI